MANIGIYGGSFDPPHKGHVAAACACQKALGLDRVLVIPAALPPHKALSCNAPAPALRLEMTKLAFAALPGFEVCDLELRRDGPSYTADTLRTLAARYPEDRLYLMMGTDMFLSFDTWREPDEIAKRAAIVCFARYQPDAALAAQLRAQAAALRQKLGAEVHVLQNEAVEVSSTEVRRLLFFSLADALLPPEVLRFIERERLYGLGEACIGLPFEALKTRSLSLHKATRRAHAAGTSQTAAALAERYGEDVTDAARAGILHDLTKALTGAQQLAFCAAHAIPVSEEERQSPGILHGKTAAWCAEHLFGENEAVCRAITFHTTGRPDMTRLEKILYMADYIEPTRDFPGVDALREAVWRDLDEGMILGLEQTMQLLRVQGKPICSASQQTLAQLLRERTAK